MATLPTSVVSPTIAAIDAAMEAGAEPPRPHLGASVIGRPCERALWYAFRWAAPEQFSGRVLRLFRRGQNEEATMVADLRRIGVRIDTLDPRTGRQFRFSAAAGHVGGSCDGIGRGFPEAPKSEHVVEFKTHSAKSFADLQAKGVQKSKPEHWAQMQLYMRWAKIDRAFYLAVNKDDDSLYSERVPLVPEEAERLEQRAERVVFSAEPPPRITEDPAWYQCKWCPARAVCWEGAGYAVNCRTCAHATPERDGDARWSCARWGADIPDAAAQRSGCAEHRVIPALLVWAEPVDADPSANWVEYRDRDGRTVRNGGDGGLSSAELSHGPHTAAFAADPTVALLRAQGAVIVDAGPPSAEPPRAALAPPAMPYRGRAA